MQSENREKAFENQPLYVGMDVHKNSWRISIRTRAHAGETFVQPPSVDVLTRHLKRHYSGARVTCVYEAGFSGFWIQRALAAHAMNCIVVHPPDIPTSDKERRGKSDKVDARRLSRELSVGSLHGIYVPSAEVEQDRILVRTREQFIGKQTRCKNQIRMRLHQLGVSAPEECADRYWSRRFIAWLEELSSGTDSMAKGLGALVRELHSLREEVGYLTQEIRALARTDRYRHAVELLCSIPGIGSLTAMIVLTEIADIHRFHNADQLASYVGLVPGERSSGESRQETGISKRRNPHLRRVIVESAWIAVEHDPVLLAKFTNLCKTKRKSVAIVAIARRLVNRIMAVLIHDEPYQIGRTTGGQRSTHGTGKKDDLRSGRVH